VAALRNVNPAASVRFRLFTPSWFPRCWVPEIAFCIPLIQRISKVIQWTSNVIQGLHSVILWIRRTQTPIRGIQRGEENQCACRTTGNVLTRHCRLESRQAHQCSRVQISSNAFKSLSGTHCQRARLVSPPWCASFWRSAYRIAERTDYGGFSVGEPRLDTPEAASSTLAIVATWYRLRVRIPSSNWALTVTAVPGTGPRAAATRRTAGSTCAP
jgi:hypothetical protein